MTPGISPFFRVPARLIWNISPLSAAHSICPGSFHRLLLLLFTFHHRQTLAWLCPNSMMCSVDTSIKTLTLPPFSEFTDVALSFVNTLTEQATETVTIRTFSNQKPWVDRTIRDAVNHRIQRLSFVGKHERVQSIMLCSPTGC